MSGIDGRFWKDGEVLPDEYWLENKELYEEAVVGWQEGSELVGLSYEGNGGHDDSCWISCVSTMMNVV